jgi:hypothetical protein
MSSADRLREAAAKARDTANGALEGTTDDWWGPEDYRDSVGPGDAEHIALWSPPVAIAVADLLDDVAADKDSGLATIHPRLLDLADLILGDTPEQRPIKVGDPATPLHAGPNCRVRNAQDWECTEPKGHDGPHIACDTGRVVAVWS